MNIYIYIYIKKKYGFFFYTLTCVCKLYRGTNMSLEVAATHKQPRLLPRYCDIGDSLAWELWLFDFSESFTRLMLRSHSCRMCWADRCCLHGPGYPFDSLRNLYTFCWQVPSLCRRRQILINSSHIKFHKNTSNGSVVYSDRRTDGEDLSVFLVLYVASLSKVNQIKK